MTSTPLSDNASPSGASTFRKGVEVPDGAANLAFVKAPKTIAGNSLSTLSTLNPSAISSVGGGCFLLYADEQGVLRDSQDRIAVMDSDPAVTNEFSIAEDFSTIPGSEYKDEHVLPYEHRSRFFHEELAGLSFAGQTTTYNSTKVRVEDSRGKEYGHYKIKIAPAVAPDGSTYTGRTWAYRVLVYIDTNERNDLKLVYNKVEVAQDGTLTGRHLRYEENLNPRKFFKRIPEATDVVDPSMDEDRHVYTTEPVVEDARNINSELVGTAGRRVVVPKKAINDPRLYQLFRWRVNIDFIFNETVDEALEDTSTINCGVLTTPQDPNGGTLAPYALMNLNNSRFSVLDTDLTNPTNLSGAKNTAAYWKVDVETADLSQFNFLVYSPSARTVDFSPYMAKLKEFMRGGGVLLIDTNGITDFGTNGPAGETTAGVYSGSGNNIPPKRRTGSVQMLDSNITWDGSDYLFSANSDLGGWDIDVDDPARPLTRRQQSDIGWKWTQYMHSVLSSAKSIMSVSSKPVVVTKDYGTKGGRMIFSTIDILRTCSSTFDYATGKQITSSIEDPTQSPEYELNVNGEFAEASMKMLYNSILLALRGNVLADDDESSISTSWSYQTKWRPSWVIDARNDVLDQEEIQSNNFSLEQSNPEDPENTEFVFKRRLSNSTLEDIAQQELDTLVSNNPNIQHRIQADRRVYSIEVTNPEVEVDQTVGAQDVPKAWTTSYSPRFEVPDDLAPFIVRKVRDEDGRDGVIPDYTASLTRKSTPEQPFAGRIRSLNTITQESDVTLTGSWTATGTAIGTYDVTVEGEDIERTIQIETTNSVRQKLSWADAHVVPGHDWYKASYPYKNATFPKGFVRPIHLSTWQNYNYKSSSFGPGNLLWPYAGFGSREQVGTSGDRVTFIQSILNSFNYAGYYSHDWLKKDGQFGAKTAAAVKDFQGTIGARFVDGVVDAETWYLFCTQMARLISDGYWSRNQSGLKALNTKILPHRMSDNHSSFYAKRSWVKNGPDVIWDLFTLTLDKPYYIEGFSISPWVGNTSLDMMVRSAHVQYGQSTYNFDADSSNVYKHAKDRPKHGEVLKKIFSTRRRGDTIVIGIGQDKPYKSGSASRMLGVKNMNALVRVTTTDIDYQTVIERGPDTIEQVDETFNFEVTGTVSVTAAGDVIRNVSYTGKPAKYDKVHGIKFTGINIDNDDIVASISQKGQARFRTYAIDTATSQDVNDGPLIPDPTQTYSMTPQGEIDPLPESGWIGKDEGVKLMCDVNGKPWGFPAFPAGVEGDELTRHYAQLSLMSEGTGEDVHLAFYDKADQEFITSPGSGIPTLSYLEYMQRGPQNVYAAVVSDYEVVEEFLDPSNEDAPRLPYKRAMPVYGVCVNEGSEISLADPPNNLGIRQVWPIVATPGSFKRRVEIRSQIDGSIAGWLSGYQGQTVEAHYTMPEATNDANLIREIRGEQPDILDDHTIQVSSAPIAMRRLPTTVDDSRSDADPVKPKLTIYTRNQTNPALWNKVPNSKIKDWQIYNGIIELVDALPSLNPADVKVDYETTTPDVEIKVSASGRKINLNPHAGLSEDLKGKPIYVYVVPQHVRDSDGNIIAGSVQSRVVEITTDASIFDPTSSTYNPLAVKIGLIHIIGSGDITQLGLLDTRSRGGGIEGEVADFSLWDSPKYKNSYPLQGYVYIKFPVGTDDVIDDLDTIDSAIERNLTAGVAYDWDLQ